MAYMEGKKDSNCFLIKSYFSGLLGHSEHFEHKREDVPKPGAHTSLTGTKEGDTEHTLQAINTTLNLGGSLGRFLQGSVSHSECPKSRQSSGNTTGVAAPLCAPAQTPSPPQCPTGTHHHFQKPQTPCSRSTLVSSNCPQNRCSWNSSPRALSPVCHLLERHIHTFPGDCTPAWAAPAPDHPFQEEILPELCLQIT